MCRRRSAPQRQAFANIRAPGVTEPLDLDRIRRALPDWTPPGDITLHDSIPSTNTWLLAHAGELATAHACLAEHQVAGRGRLGRTWIDGRGRDLCLSVLWRFTTRKLRSQGLSLAIGVAAVRALRASGAGAVGLKWPNDVVWRDRKLAGILVEGVAGDSIWTAVIGIGVNVGKGEDARVELPACDLESIPGARTSRNQLAARLIAEIRAECMRFERGGFDTVLGEWQALDVMKGRPVTVLAPAGAIQGVARGVDPSGELLVEVDGRVERFVSAEVSLRARRSDELREGAG